MSTLDPPVAPITRMGGAPNALNSLVDLLNATAHQPWHHDDSSEFPSDEEDETSTTEDDHEAVTPGGSQAILDPHHYHGEDAEGGAAPVRGMSLLAGDVTRKDLIQELTLDNIDSADAVVERSQLKGDGTEADQEAFEDPEVMDAAESPAERLKALVEEFGPWNGGGSGEEEFVQSIPGALYRGVLIKGVLALTNRRLFIFAYIPRNPANKVIRAGPVTVHFPGKLMRKRRSWIELKSDSVTWYASSARIYKPIGACRLSQVKEIGAYNPEKPREIYLSLIDGRERVIELDTAESAVAWHGDMIAALFTFRATADKLRLALPLRLVTRMTREPYMSLGEKVEVDFDSGRCEATLSDGASTHSNESEGSSTPQSVAFGYLKNHCDFYDDMEKYINLAKTETGPCGARPVLEIDSDMRAKDEQLQQEFTTELGKEKGLASEFQKMFALPEPPVSLFLAPNVQLVRTLPTWGTLCISSTFLCFWKKVLVGSDVKLRIPIADIDDAVPCKAFGFRIVGLAIQVHGSPDVRLDFHSKKLRDEVITKIKDAVLAFKTQALHIDPSPATSPLPTRPTQTTSPLASGTTTPSAVPSSPGYTLNPYTSNFAADPSHYKVLGVDLEENPKIPIGLQPTDTPKVLGTIGYKRLSGLHVFCLTIGSRGDVQPYISLALELMKDGNRVTIASHPEYRAWVEGYGIGYKEVGGDPAALMKLSVEHKMFSPGFFKESLGGFRQWLDDLFAESWHACQEADILIESPSTMAGIHVAEGLGIPYFRAFTMPWTATSTYPQAFAASVDLGPTYNQLSYSMFDTIIWKATAGQVNRWRKNMMGLEPTNLHKMAQAKVPFVYNFSSALVPKPNDWKDHIFISGYWFLDSDAAWKPPAGLLEFIQKARDDGKPVMYIGFGSIVVPDAAAVTKAVVAAVKNADVRAVLSKGWSERGATNVEEVPLPEEIFSVPSIAHDRLFPLIDAACHHGGAGTTGASLRAGLPTLIHPFFGDQHFWAGRVSKIGAGVAIRSLTEKDLTAAFKAGTTDRVMKEKAAALGEKIRAENGPREALNFIYNHIHLAQERADLRAARARTKKSTLSHTDSLRSSSPDGSRSSSPSRSSRPFASSTLSGKERTSSFTTSDKDKDKDENRCFVRALKKKMTTTRSSTLPPNGVVESVVRTDTDLSAATV
ncbi:hypothetical protein MNV49_002067 [Pseudohyphozyma bogoriensis]|nr:hypothetical protein MNV49_002067 [Pseudohyphozyma bogoriensis]